MVLRLLQHLEIVVMIKEMEAVTHTSTLSGFLYEGLATEELAAGASSDLVLTKMEAEEGTTTFCVPSEGRPIVSPIN